MRSIPPAYLAQAISLGGSAALTFGTAVLLSASERGELAVFMLIATMGSYLLGLGVPSQALQLSAKKKLAEVRHLVVLQIPQVAVLSLVAFAVLQTLQPFPFIQWQILALAVGTAAVGAIFNTFAWLEYGSSRYFVSTALRGLIPGAAFALAFAAFLTGALDVQMIAIAYFGAQFIGLLILIIRNRLILRRHPGAQWSATPPWQSEALGYFLMQSLVMGLVRLPTIVVALWFGPVATAVVSVALSLTEVQAALPQMRSAITFTEVSKESGPRLTALHVRSAIAALVPGSVAVIAASIVCAWILPEEYSALWQYVLVMLLGSALMALAASGLNVLAARKQFLLPSAILGIAIALSTVLAMISATALIATAAWSLTAAIAGLVILLVARRPAELRSSR